MNKTKILAVAALAFSASSAFADMTAKDNLTSTGNVLVKTPYGECVKVLGNVNAPSCHPKAAPKPAPVPVPPPAPQIETIKLSADAFFAINSSRLKPAGKAAIHELAEKINSRGAEIHKITVVGHTSSTGTAKYNLGLSKRRAATVATYLVRNGVPASIITAYGVGEAHPDYTNKTRAGRAKNRRVDVIIEGTVTVQK